MAMEETEKKERTAKLWREWRGLMLTILILTAVRSAIADWNDVPSGSMNPTIVEGDRVFVNKLAYDLKIPFTTTHIAQWSNPRRGDIVVFFFADPTGSPTSHQEGYWIARRPY